MKTRKLISEWNWRDILGAWLVLAFIGAMVALLWKAIPKENEQLLSYMLGQLSGFVAGVVGYHYITKSGEKELELQRAKNTEEGFKALQSASASMPPNMDVEAAAQDTADAAQDKADEISKK